MSEFRSATNYAAAALLVMAAVCAACQAPAADGPTGYRSSVLGVSIDPPEGWECRTVPTCGSGWVGKSREELKRIPRLLKGLHHADDVWMHLYSIERFEGAEASQHEKWLHSGAAQIENTPFSFADGYAGRRLVCTGAGCVDPPAESNRSLTYIAGLGPRRFELRTWCPTRLLAERMPQFDAVARRLRILDPVVDVPTPGVWKTGRIAGLRFDYPGEWELRRSVDDDANLRAKSVTLEPPGRPDTRREIWPSIVIGRDGVTRKGWDLETTIRELCSFQSPTQMIGCRRWTSGCGLPGWRIELAPTSADSRASQTVIFAYSLPGGEVLNIHASASQGNFERWLPEFEQIAACVTPDE